MQSIDEAATLTQVIDADGRVKEADAIPVKGIRNSGVAPLVDSYRVHLNCLTRQRCETSRKAWRRHVQTIVLAGKTTSQHVL
jgi:hypothetical protein